MFWFKLGIFIFVVLLVVMDGSLYVVIFVCLVINVFWFLVNFLYEWNVLVVYV